MSRVSAEQKIHFRKRESVELPVSLPKEVVESLGQVAEERDMSVEALVRQYIGMGLRQDISRLYGERVLASVARVLARHMDSAEEVEVIVRELREAAGGPAARWARNPK